MSVTTVRQKEQVLYEGGACGDAFRARLQKRAAARRCSCGGNAGPSGRDGFGACRRKRARRGPRTSGVVCRSGGLVQRCGWLRVA
jgi:hypothetical protein